MDFISNVIFDPASFKKKTAKIPNIDCENKVTESVKVKTNVKLKSSKPTTINPSQNAIKPNKDVIKAVVTSNNTVKSTVNGLSEKNNFQKNDRPKAQHKSMLDLDEDANIKDMEKFLSSTSGKNSEPVFSDKSFTKYTELHPHLIKTLSDRMKITVSTAIQEKSIPPLLEGKDVLIKSATGSGKTLSYAIPLVNSLQAIEPPINRKSGIYALIISPTQELAVQTQDVLIKLTNPFVRIVTGVLMGGVKCLVQKRAIKKGLNILIATPNRLLYHLEKNMLKLDKLLWFVIDEADRMTELGFADNIKKLVEIMAKQPSCNVMQTVLLSATLSKGVENLAGLTLKNPVRAEVEFTSKSLPETVVDNQDIVATTTTSSELFSMPEGLQHYLLVCPTKLRMVALLSFLLLKCKYGKHTGKVVVFMATQDLVEFHYQLFHVFLKNKSLLQELPNAEDTQIDQTAGGIDIFQLHGGMEHDKRQAVFKKFSACASGFLLTTDVCSRGLDMTGINWVVQYHPPGQPVDYIHRVGRTARAGSKGKALLFLQPAEVNYINHLQNSVGGIHIQKISLRSIMQTALHHAGTLKYRKAVHTVEESIFLTAKLLEEHVSLDMMLSNLCRTAFKSLVRSYASFNKEMRQFFQHKDLHLGHVAKSMACKETPKEISKSYQRNVGDTKMNIDKRKKFESKVAKRKLSSVKNEGQKNDAKKPKLDQAHRNMFAEYGI